MRKLIAFMALVALSVGSVVTASPPAAEATDNFVVSVGGIRRGPAGSTQFLSRADVPSSLRGRICTGLAAVGPGSIHANNDLLLSSAGNTIVFPDVESGPDRKTTPGSGAIGLGSEVVVEVRLGADGVYSGDGGLITLSCNPPPQPKPVGVTLRVEVINNDGGTGQAGAFTLTATGTISGNQLSGPGPTVNGQLEPDTFTLTNTGPAGYSVGNWACVGAGTTAGNQLNLATGTATCTITADDIPSPQPPQPAPTPPSQPSPQPPTPPLQPSPQPPSPPSQPSPQPPSPEQPQPRPAPLSQPPAERAPTPSEPSQPPPPPPPQPTITIEGVETTCSGEVPTINYRLTASDLDISVDEVVAVMFDVQLRFLSRHELTALTGSFRYPGREEGPSGERAGTTGGRFVVFVNGRSVETVAFPAAPARCADGEQPLRVWPECVDGIPHIGYELLGGGAGETSTIVARDLNLVDHQRLTDQPRRGRVLWPGSSTDPRDWPGWQSTETGAWLEDPSDLRLRNGGTLIVELDDGAAATVAYPMMPSACSEPSPPPPPVSVTLRNVVVNDDGGTSRPADWTLTAEGADANDVEGPGPSITARQLRHDTFVLDQTGPENYTTSEWNCTAGRLVGNELTLTAGKGAICTVTHDDNPQPPPEPTPTPRPTPTTPAPTPTSVAPEPTAAPTPAPDQPRQELFIVLDDVDELGQPLVEASCDEDFSYRVSFFNISEQTVEVVLLLGSERASPSRPNQLLISLDLPPELQIAPTRDASLVLEPGAETDAVLVVPVRIADGVDAPSTFVARLSIQPESTSLGPVEVKGDLQEPTVFAGCEPQE